MSDHPRYPWSPVWNDPTASWPHRIWDGFGTLLGIACVLVVFALAVAVVARIFT